MTYKFEIKNKRVGNFQPKAWNDYTKFLVLPFTDTLTLDDSLDSATVDLRGLGKTRIKNFTKVRITKGEKAQTYVVANDLITEIVGTGKYNHKLTLIEETKILEKITVDSCTVTQPLYENYMAGRIETDPITTKTSLGADMLAGNNLVKYYDVYNEGEINIIRPAKTSDTDTASALYPYSISVYSRDFKAQDSCSVSIKKDGRVIKERGENIGFTINLKSGVYEIVYKMVYSTTYQGVPVTETSYAIFTIAIVPKIEDIKKITVTDTVNKLLNICETKQYGQPSKFTFNEKQAQKYALIKCPEFSFTRSTLRECLDQIAGAYSCITRLEDNVIYFDEMSSKPTLAIYPFETLQEKFNKLKYISNQTTQDIEQYCSEIDTIASNLVKTNISDTESISSPFYDAYKTVRAENVAVRINEDTAVIQTEYPIEKITRVLVGGIKLSNGEVLTGYDITKYIYEASAYSTLSSITGAYPFSKAYALYYEQNGTSIKGLNFTLPNPISSIFSHPAIVNILEKATGKSIQNIFNVQSFTQILFRVEYVPIVTARINQTKTDVKEYEDKMTSIYNQTANKIDAYSYGENLKGAVARLGNIEITRTYIFKDYTDWAMNKSVLGEIIDGYGISAISTENMPDYIKVTYYFAKDFNRKNKYIGIKNNQRMWEVSEKQVQDRFIIWNDYCVIGDDFNSYNLEGNVIDKGLMTDYAILTFAHTFEPYSSKAITGVNVKGENQEGDIVSDIMLPVISVGVGNSMLFSFEYKDNYSAGDVSLEGTNATGNEYYRVQGNAPYSDYFGKLRSISFLMFDEGVTSGIYERKKEIADNLPLKTENIKLEGLTVQGDGIQIEKDNREKISFSYQLNFISGWDNLIIGSALSRVNTLIAKEEDTQTSAKFVLFYYPIDKFADDVTDNIKRVVKTLRFGEDVFINLGKQPRILLGDQKIDNITGISGWGIIKTINGRDYLLLGQNFTQNYTGEYTIKMPTFNFVHPWEQLNYLLNYEEG